MTCALSRPTVLLTLSMLTMTSAWAAEPGNGKISTQQPTIAAAKARGTQPAESDTAAFNVLPGYQVELLYTVPKEEQGSWVSIAFDDSGRLLASDQGDKGLFRITPPEIGSDQPTQVESLAAEITAAQGLLHAFGNLYVSVNGGPGSGLYRLKDTDDDDQYDEVTKLKDIRGAGEHGPHALRLSPDGKSIYWVAGNHTLPPADFDHSRLPKNWGEDLLLPRQWDANGHARGILAPGGWIAKTDPDGKTWDIISAGYRNSYDMDFNADGELFAYDSDMEWDFGTPWYRPTRVTHAVSGSEFGWRSGTGKWPAYYVDSLPPVIEIGPGSPVGATFGYGARFPARYQKAFFICDWTFGTMYAVHLEPDGASYRASKEEFLSRTPLPLTDAAVGPDGALYFTVGGRGTQSELYRVTYVGDEPTRGVDAKNSQFAELRQLRRQIEQYHHPADDADAAVDFVWPHLSHADRFIRYAARVALEHQPVAAWQDRVLAEQDPLKLITAAVAFTRQADPSLQGELLSALERIDPESLDETPQLDLLRVYQLAFIRMGRPDAEDPLVERLVARLASLYPAASGRVNRELVQLLVYLESPVVVTKTIALMQQPSQQETADLSELLARNAGYGKTVAEVMANQVDLQKLHYAFVLRNAREGWSIDQRRFYWEWLQEARSRSGGSSYQGFLNNIEQEAFDNAKDSERLAIEAFGLRDPYVAPELPAPHGPASKLNLQQVLELAETELKGRDFENGKRAYAAARCVVCHRFAGEGGATGPDLTQVAGRFNAKDLAESILDPSKVISDQYRASVVVTSDGLLYTGRIVADTDSQLTVLVDPEDSTKVVDVPKDDVEELRPSPVSIMPEGLLDPLNQDEVLDLLAYLLSRGNPEDPMFRP